MLLFSVPRLCTVFITVMYIRDIRLLTVSIAISLAVDLFHMGGILTLHLATHIMLDLKFR